MSWQQAEIILQKTFGYPSFRPGQRKIIESLLQGHHTMGIMPTGGGKSICYQVPALMFPGITIVISPLISLMKDQVDNLRQIGIPATYINRSLTMPEIDRRIRQLQEGRYKLLYIAPERLESSRFQAIFESLPIYLVTIDEAHCISHWGHDFRPSYRSMAEHILSLPRKPLIAALTATATPEVREDIATLLKIPRSRIFSNPLRRENLSFFVRQGVNKLEFIRQYLRRHTDQNGIIYCSTRKEVDQLHETLHGEGFSVAKYHAGMPDQERERSQEMFSYDQLQVIIATNAFGMGIDKSNVRFVIHYNLPRNLEMYYQEAGRAGRDGEESECILLFSPQDIPIQEFLIEQSELAPERKEREKRKLDEMVQYACTSECLQVTMIRYFGDRDTKPCGKCGNCRKRKQEMVDLTVEAQKVFSCIKRMQEQFGLTLIAKVLRGSKNKKLSEWNLQKLSTYGIMADRTEKEILHLLQILIAEGYVQLVKSEYSFPLARLTAKAAEVLKGKRRVTLWKKELAIPEVPERMPTLLDALGALRKRLSEQEKLPPYMLFQDSTLKEMSRQTPLTLDELKKIPGIGEAKCEKYGEQLLHTIRQYVKKHGMSRKQRPHSAKDKGNSHLVSYRLFHEGKAIEEIAAERGLTTGTIEDHLLRAGIEGYPLDWDAFIPPHLEDEIMKAIDELGAHKLRPIKDRLPEEVTYMAIKAAIAKRQVSLNRKEPVSP